MATIREDPEAAYSVPQLAQEWGVDVVTLRNRITAGELPAFWVGPQGRGGALRILKRNARKYRREHPAIRDPRGRKKRQENAPKQR